MSDVTTGQITSGFRLLSWLFPTRPLAQATPLSLEQLQAKYRWKNRLLSVLFLLVAPALAAGACWLALEFSDWLYTPAVSTLHVVRRGNKELCCYAIGVVFFGHLLLLLLLIRLLLRRDYREYMAYLDHSIRIGEQPYPMSVARVAWLFFLCCSLPLVWLIAFKADHYTVFTDEAIVENPFWSFRQTIVRPYDTVSGLYEVQFARTNRGDEFAPTQVILFNDGSRWESERSGTGPLRAEHQRFMEYVARRSGKPIQPVNYLQDVPRG